MGGRNHAASNQCSLSYTFLFTFSFNYTSYEHDLLARFFCYNNDFG